MTTDEALAWADKVLAHLHGMDLQHGPNEATGHLAVLAAEVRRLRQDNLELRVQLRGEADARVGDIEELSAGNATLERDLAAARAEAAEALSIARNFRALSDEAITRSEKAEADVARLRGLVFAARVYLGEPIATMVLGAASGDDHE